MKTKKQKILLTILIPLLLIALIVPISLKVQEDLKNEALRNAQENTERTQNTYFDLTLERGSQTPFGKYVPYILTITPHLDSSKTQVLWNVPSTLEAKPKHPEFVNLDTGKTYTFEGKIKPLKSGTYDFSISVLSWQYDTNYTNSISDNLTFDNNLVLQPMGAKYRYLNILKFALIGIAFIGLTILTVIVVKSYMKKAKKWLTPPDWQ